MGITCEKECLINKQSRSKCQVVFKMIYCWGNTDQWYSIKKSETSNRNFGLLKKRIPLLGHSTMNSTIGVAEIS